MTTGTTAAQKRASSKWAKNNPAAQKAIRDRYYAKNKEKCKQRALDSYYNKHEHNKERTKRYSQDHKEQKTEYSRKRRHADPEREKEVCKAYYHRNKDKCNERSREYFKANREHAGQYVRLYQARRACASPPWLTTEQKMEMKRLYQERNFRNCVEGLKPGSAEYWTVDHIVPLRGQDVCGLHVPWNLRLIRHGSNSSKRNKLT